MSEPAVDPAAHGFVELVDLHNLGLVFKQRNKNFA